MDPVTNDDLASFLGSKSRREVYRGVEDHEIVIREADKARFFTHAYFGLVLVVALLTARYPDRRLIFAVPVALLPLSLLVRRQQRLQGLLVLCLTRGTRTGAKKRESA